MRLAGVMVSWFVLVFIVGMFFNPVPVALAYAVIVAGSMGLAGYLLMKILTKLSEGIPI
jgi:hypothetical protein